MEYQNENYREALNRELLCFAENGVTFSVNGRSVQPDEGLVDILLSSKDCTYMRNYKFKSGRIDAIDFERLPLGRK